MENEFELLEVDWLTAQMYGRNLPKRKNDVPFSKNGIELVRQLDDEVDSTLDMIDHSLFAPRREKFWDNDPFEL